MMCNRASIVIAHHSKCGFHCSHEQGQNCGAKYPPRTDEVKKGIQEAGGNADHGIKARLFPYLFRAVVPK